MWVGGNLVFAPVNDPQVTRGPVRQVLTTYHVHTYICQSKLDLAIKNILQFVKVYFNCFVSIERAINKVYFLIIHVYVYIFITALMFNNLERVRLEITAPNTYINKKTVRSHLFI